MLCSADSSGHCSLTNPALQEVPAFVTRRCTSAEHAHVHLSGSFQFGPAICLLCEQKYNNGSMGYRHHIGWVNQRCTISILPRWKLPC